MGGRGGSGVRNTATEEKFEYKRSADLKEWSAAEEKRTQETSKMVNRYLYAAEEGEGRGNFGEFYDTDSEDVFTQELGEAYGTRSNVEATISKAYFTYAQGHDENWKRVTKGKRVAGSTYYSADIDGMVLDENVGGYKTFADAKHALDLELDYMKQRASWYKNRRKTT